MADKFNLKDDDKDDYDEHLSSSDDDDYTENEKLLLHNVKNVDAASESSEEEVLAVGSEDDESDESDKNAESDIEKNEEDVPDDRAWGKGKRAYYSTDYVDADFSGYRAKDVDAAKLEEEEARKIQQRLIEQFDDDDYVLDFCKTEPKESKDIEKGDSTIKTDISTLLDGEKVDLLKKESPELIGLIDDFNEKLNEVSKVLGPVLDLVSNSKLNENRLVEFIRLKYNIVMKYLMHINFYLLLKSARVNVKYHPVVKELIKYRELYNQLNTAHTDIVQNEIEAILNPKTVLKRSKRVVKHVENTEKKKEHIINKSSDVKIKKSVQFVRVEEIKEPSFMESQIGNEPNEVSTESTPTDVAMETDDKLEDMSRPITYEMAKNKGLTPHRKKEQRNPRVKHRNKYRKAIIRRKGAVREVRKELTRYAGEISGIKASVSKSVKIK